MAVKYETRMKEARMNAGRLAVAGGSLEICSASGQCLAKFPISGSGGEVDGDTWTLRFDNDRWQATSSARATMARISDSAGQTCISGLTVGMDKEKADVLINNTQINKGQQVALVGDQAISHA